MQKNKREEAIEVEFDYFYNRDGDRFSYYMLPKIIVTDERFKNLSSDAKILYSCLLERTSMSFSNKWIDEENRVYIIFTVEEIMEILGRSNKTAVKILNELDSTSGGIGLIKRNISTTRMRDFYDLYNLYNLRKEDINFDIPKQAIISTANRRESLSLMKQAIEIIDDIKEDDYLKKLWKVYLADNLYIGDLNFL